VPTRAGQVQPTSAQAQLTPGPSPTATLAARTLVPTAAPTRIPTVEASPTTLPTPEPRKVDETTLPTQKFAAHFVASKPEHADLLSRAPSAIQLNFNLTLARNFNINVRKDGAKMTLGQLSFSENRLQMEVELPNAGAGRYHVPLRVFINYMLPNTRIRLYPANFIISDHGLSAE